MHKLLIPVIAILILLAMVFYLSGEWDAVGNWAATLQHDYQQQMASTIRALKQEDNAAFWGLVGACFAYGFVHAVGPGHGKVLIGGASLASRATIRRMVMLAITSSLAQSLTAILLIYGTLTLIKTAARDIVGISEAYLAPFSFAMMAAIGLYLMIRGAKQLFKSQTHHHDHHHEHDDHCSHAHGPSLKEVETLEGWKPTLALISAVAIRPCSGALFVLAIAYPFGLYWAGAIAVIAMGLGTALFTTSVATGSVLARDFATKGTNLHKYLPIFALIQIVAGGLIAFFSAAMFFGTV